MSDVVIGPPVDVEAGLNYPVPTGVKPAAYAYDPPPGVPCRTDEYRRRVVTILNARREPPPGGLSLDRMAFERHCEPPRSPSSSTTSPFVRKRRFSPNFTTPRATA